ncbi:MAG: glutamate-cysteine ligase family protein [Myxococcota bacterium]
MTALSYDDLLAPYFEAETPRQKWVIGTEAEKFGVYANDQPVRYEDGIVRVLKILRDEHGWTPTPETAGGPLIALGRGRASITLEPGGQLELSGSPLDSIHQTHLEFLGHRTELRRIGDRMGIEWLGLGYHPYARQEDLDWVPKLRYGIMRDYLLTRGARARDMMRRTCTVQANLDYADEADATRKLRVSLAASPIVTAMFANSPWSEGRTTGEHSHRAGVWLDVDPDRTGMLPFMWDDASGYREYVEWGLDAPMFMFKRDGKVVANTGQPFRDFMKNGFEGHQATRTDWDTHLATLFPEVRLKSTLELRSTDGQRLDLVCALPALWKGLLYDETSLSALEKALSSIEYEAAAQAQRDVPAVGLGASYGGRTMHEWRTELLDLADAGLRRIGHLNGEDDESIYLAPLRALEDTPAAALLKRAPGDAPTAEAVIEAARF